MLDNGFKYENEIRAADLNCWYDPRYKWFYGASHAPFALPTEYGDWAQIIFASLNHDGDVIGQISCAVDRPAGSVDNLCAINYSQKPHDKMTFGADLYRSVDAMFTKFGFQRLQFTVKIGNPAERAYDRLVERAGGRIVGILRRYSTIADGTIVDGKIYEILRSDYLATKAVCASEEDVGDG